MAAGQSRGIRRSHFPLVQSPECLMCETLSLNELNEAPEEEVETEAAGVSQWGKQEVPL